LQKWLASQRARRGAVLTLPQLWQLTQPWYGERMSPDFHGRSREQVQEIFKEAGLTSDFWRVD
jgi:hypothetical protein